MMPEDRQATGGMVESEPIVILNPAGLHARPAAVLVNAAKQFSAKVKIARNDREVNAKSVVGVMGLGVKHNDTVVLKAEGDDAATAVATLAELVRSGLGEDVSGDPESDEPDPQDAKPPAQDAQPPQGARDPNVFAGAPASPGVVAGRVFQLRHAEIEVDEKGRGAAAERAALLGAISEAKRDLAKLEENLRASSDPGKAAIFAAHRELIEDPELIDATDKRIDAGQSAAYAWRAAYTASAQTLSAVGNELLAARANDIRDIGRRVLAHLAGVMPENVETPENSILIAPDLTPSDTAGLDQSRVVGFCTTGGSATSHASILARSAGIPAVAAIEARALDIPNGTPAILDGERGELRLNPSERDMTETKRRQEQAARARAEAFAASALAAVTLDGHRVKVVGNISGLAEAEEIPALGGEGVGLLRSEFLFLQRTEAPTEAEQASVYVAIAKALGGARDLVVRTLDVGGDKPLSYMPLPHEENPFLGVRGIRLNLLGTDLFRSQVRAALHAAPHTNLCIMFPMISGVDELRDAKRIVLQEKEAMGVREPVQIGIMVEVPSAALMAEYLAEEADFFSIGTNDLTQYTLAIDRGHPKLAHMADALHPAVLRLMAMTVAGAHKHGKWVGICGGVASEPLAAPVLIGLGLDELSVSIKGIPTIKAAVRHLEMKRCKEIADAAMNMRTAEEVRAYLKKEAQK